MKIAIVGLSNSGKTTLFNALTGLRLETTNYPTQISEPHIGIVKVPDSRVDKLSELFKPKKTTYATVQYVDYIGLTKGDIAQNTKVFDLIKDADAIVHVVRCFEDDAVAHPMSKIDPLTDMQTLELELIFGDLEFVQKRLERIEENSKKGKKPDDNERQLLLKCKQSLEAEIPLRNLKFTEDEQKAMRHLQFVCTKPEIVVFNIAEKDLNTDRTKELMSKAFKYLNDKPLDAGLKPPHTVMALCAKVEMELTELHPEDAKAFLQDLHISEPALNKLITTSYELLGLISFLTAGEDEVRAWTISQGTVASKAAGKIHSDIERGFIRAEVISYDDFINAGSMAVAKQKGLLRLEGKTYVVQDGDIINFRFNV